MKERNVEATCANCPVYCASNPYVGRCRHNLPVAEHGWPVVKQDDWCALHPNFWRDADPVIAAKDAEIATLQEQQAVIREACEGHGVNFTQWLQIVEDHCQTIRDLRQQLMEVEAKRDAVLPLVEAACEDTLWNCLYKKKLQAAVKEFRQAQAGEAI